MAKPNDEARFKVMHLLPNALTTCALCAGFVSIALSIQGIYDAAAQSIFIAMIADGLDGRVARLTETTSAFGKQYDSLSDMVSFGVAPAIMLLTGPFAQWGHLGWSISFIYAAFAAIRLAKFNITDTVHTDFIGLPSPSAAALVASILWVLTGHPLTQASSVALGVLALLLGSLMVSPVIYPSFKCFDFRKRYTKFLICLFIVMCAAVVINPPYVLAGLFAIYVLWGPIWMGVNACAR